MRVSSTKAGDRTKYWKTGRKPKSAAKFVDVALQTRCFKFQIIKRIRRRRRGRAEEGEKKRKKEEEQGKKKETNNLKKRKRKQNKKKLRELTQFEGPFRRAAALLLFPDPSPTTPSDQVLFKNEDDAFQATAGPFTTLKAFVFFSR